jgi:hypothetical protein
VGASDAPAVALLREVLSRRSEDTLLAVLGSSALSGEARAVDGGRHADCLRLSALAEYSRRLERRVRGRVRQIGHGL